MHPPVSRDSAITALFRRCRRIAGYNSPSFVLLFSFLNMVAKQKVAKLSIVVHAVIINIHPLIFMVWLLH
jgi:hypothetical protein